MAAQRITFVVDLFNAKDAKTRARSDKALEILLEALTRIDEMYLRDHPDTPLLYQSGVVYMEEPPGAEDWQDIPVSRALRWADCEDLACWRAAELRVRGVKAKPIFTRETQADGTQLFHIQVQLPDGSVEDPSRQLGMR